MQSTPENESKRNARVVVLGLGCSGGRIIAGLASDKTPANFQTLAVDTDLKDLQAIPGATPVHLGQEWNFEDGCGGDPEIGERVVSGAEDRLLTILEQPSLLIVVAGLGGGTGTGGAKILARIARDHAIPTLFVLTLPFSFEGNWPRRQAEAALTHIREITDTVMVVHNDLLFTSVSADVPARQAFLQLDHMLAKAIYGLLGIAWADWLLKTDFATIRNLLQQHPARCDLGFGLGNGKDRWRDAVESFIECPLLGGPEHIRQINAAVITVGSDEDISVAELRQCMAAVQHHFPDDARLLIGAYASPMHVNEVQITGICCRFNQQKENPGPPLFQATSRHSTKDDELTAANNHIGRQRKKRKGQAGTHSPVQEELPFQEEMLGIFSGTPPTIFHGENLDAPTYQRRGIILNLGSAGQPG